MPGSTRARTAAPTEVPSTTRVLAIASGKGGVGKSSVTVNLAAALAARGLTVGVLDADIWGFSVPRMLGVEGRLGGSDGKIEPNVVPVGDGTLKVVSMGFLVDDESTALMWRGLILTKALEQFLTDVRWGETRLPAHRHAARHRRHADGAVAHAAAGRDARGHHTRRAPRRRSATRVADMARRSYMKVVGVVENMSEFVAPDGSRHAVFGEGGGAALAEEIGVPLVARIPIEPAVSSGGDLGRPVVLDCARQPGRVAFADLAARIVDELLPPIEMAGCTARLLDLVGQIEG